MKNVPTKLSSGTFSDILNKDLNLLPEGSTFIETSNYIYKVNVNHFYQSLTITRLGLKMSKSTKTIPSTKSPSIPSGRSVIQEQKSDGIKECSILKSCDTIPGESSVQSQLKLSSTTGSQEKSTPTTTIKEPFIHAPFSPNTLACSKCGRSTFILIYDRSGRKPSIVTRCKDCGTRGKIVPENFSTLFKHRTK